MNFSITAEHIQHDISRFVNIFVCCLSNDTSMIVKLFSTSHFWSFFFFFYLEYVYENGKFKVTDKMKEDFENYGYIMIRY